MRSLIWVFARRKCRIVWLLCPGYVPRYCAWLSQYRNGTAMGRKWWNLLAASGYNFIQWPWINEHSYVWNKVHFLLCLRGAHCLNSPFKFHPAPTPSPLDPREKKKEYSCLLCVKGLRFNKGSVKKIESAWHIYNMYEKRCRGYSLEAPCGDASKE